MALSTSQSCASGLSLKRSETDPFSTGPLRPPFEKSSLNQIPIYSVGMKGTRQPVAGNQRRMGEGTLCNNPVALVKWQNPREGEISQLSCNTAPKPTEPRPELTDYLALRGPGRVARLSEGPPGTRVAEGQGSLGGVA